MTPAKPCVTKGKFTLLSYNLLADLYATVGISSIAYRAAPPLPPAVHRLPGRLMRDCCLLALGLGLALPLLQPPTLHRPSGVHSLSRRATSLGTAPPGPWPGPTAAST